MFSESEWEADSESGWVFCTPHVDAGLAANSVPSRAESPLQPAEHVALLDVIDALASAKSPSEFVSGMDRNLQKILPHAGFACALGTMDESGFRPREILVHRFPREYLKSLRSSDGRLDCLLISQLHDARTSRPDGISRVSLSLPDPWKAKAAAYGLRKPAICVFDGGQLSPASFYCFDCAPGVNHERHMFVLARLVTHMHAALMRIVEDCASKLPSSAAIALTPRQAEVLKWLHIGKTNWEISRIIGTSERNVKYHIARIFSMLGVGSRAQAVAKAVSLRLIDVY